MGPVVMTALLLLQPPLLLLHQLLPSLMALSQYMQPSLLILAMASRLLRQHLKGTARLAVEFKIVNCKS